MSEGDSLDLYYTDIVEIGYGVTSKVYSAIRKSDGVKVAVKLIPLDKIEYFRNELEMLGRLSQYPDCSQYVSCIYGSYQDDNYLVVEMEYLEGSDLFDFINDNDLTEWPYSFKWNLMFQLAEGLAYIHGKGVAHRDVKPENIMISPDFDCTYIDVGFACAEDCKGSAGTPMYVSPERLRQNLDWLPAQMRLNIMQAADIWALGVVFYLIVYGRDPMGFDTFTPDIKTHDGYRAFVHHVNHHRIEYPHTDDPQGIMMEEIIKQMLDRDWTARIKADRLVEMIGTCMNLIH